MRTKSFTKIILVQLLLYVPWIMAASSDPLSFKPEAAIELALQNNHLINVKRLQIDEKQQKVNEDRIKYLPVIAVGGSYQYNTNLPSFTIDQGQFGQLPFGGIIIPLPPADEVIEVGDHNVYNAGVTVYQPLTQLGKISSGVKVSKTELQIARPKKTKQLFRSGKLLKSSISVS